MKVLVMRRTLRRTLRRTRRRQRLGQQQGQQQRQQGNQKKSRRFHRGGNNNNSNNNTSIGSLGEQPNNNASNTVDLVKAFFSIIEENDLRGLRRFLENNPDFDINVKKDNMNALWHLLMNELDYESEDIIKLLIEKGLNVHETNEDGETVLFALAYNQPFDEMDSILNTLLDAGLDINHTSNDGSNVYHAINSIEIITYESYKLLFDLGLNFMYEHDNDSAMRGFLNQIDLSEFDFITELFNKFPTVATQVIDEMSYFQLFLMELDLSWDEIMENEHKIIGIIEIFLAHGLDLNKPYKDGDTALHSFVKFSNDNEIDILMGGPYEEDNAFYNIAKFLLQKGANPKIKNSEGKTPADLSDSMLIKHVLTYSENAAEESTEIWGGWTRADIAHMDDIFHEAIATNSNLTKVSEEESLFSMCPVCLKYIQHETGTCMYMTHNCKTMGGFYHKKLYEKYRYFKTDVFGRPTNQEAICWCTLCGRICKDHQHYELAAWNGAMPRLLPAGRPYETDCRMTNGGGGKPEKLARYRRLREFIAEDMNELVGTMKKQDAYEQMVQEMWNAPLVSRAARIKKIETTKEWNIPTTAFPAPKINTNTNAPNIPYNGQLPLLHPVETDAFTNAMYVDDENIIQFRHGANQHAGPGQQISREAFIGFLKDVLSDPTSERFGKCWQFATAAQQSAMTPEQKVLVCPETLHPEEVRAALDMADPEQVALYEGYRKQFNRRFQNPQN